VPILCALLQFLHPFLLLTLPLLNSLSLILLPLEDEGIRGLQLLALKSIDILRYIYRKLDDVLDQLKDFQNGDEILEQLSGFQCTDESEEMFIDQYMHFDEEEETLALDKDFANIHSAVPSNPDSLGALETNDSAVSEVKESERRKASSALPLLIVIPSPILETEYIVENVVINSGLLSSAKSNRSRVDSAISEVVKRRKSSPSLLSPLSPLPNFQPSPMLITPPLPNVQPSSPMLVPPPKPLTLLPNAQPSSPMLLSPLPNFLKFESENAFPELSLDSPIKLKKFDFKQFKETDKKRARVSRIIRHDSGAAEKFIQLEISTNDGPFETHSVFPALGSSTTLVPKLKTRKSISNLLYQKMFKRK
jgi:hypothetical protein